MQDHSLAITLAYSFHNSYLLTSPAYVERGLTKLHSQNTHKHSHLWGVGNTGTLYVTRKELEKHLSSTLTNSKLSSTQHLRNTPLFCLSALIWSVCCGAHKCLPIIWGDVGVMHLLSTRGAIVHYKSNDSAGLKTDYLHKAIEEQMLWGSR